jgi:G6PDH family F420-dependent oxidoreductase
MKSFAGRKTPIKPSCGFCKAHTKRPPTWANGIAPRWNDRLETYDKEFSPQSHTKKHEDGAKTISPRLFTLLRETSYSFVDEFMGEGMIEIGYKLCSEEQSPNELIECARSAEEAGFSFAMISDHFHPWIDRQGQSSFVWTVIGAIAQVTEHLKIGTGVTCPTMRIHPVIIAQAAATAAAMAPGRFILGVGAGENLNEHVLGQHWPEADVRQEMLEEAVEVIRLLWQGGQQSHYGKYYTVENARLYTLPDEPPPIIVAASGPKGADLAGRIGDGLCATSPDKDTVQKFEKAGGKGKPRFAELTVCWAETEAKARRTAREFWPNAAIKGELTQILPAPAHFEQASKMVTEEDVAKEILCGPNPKPHFAKLEEYAEAGFDHVWVHQVGPNQEGLFRFYEEEIFPKLPQRLKAKSSGKGKKSRAAGGGR